MYPAHKRLRYQQGNYGVAVAKNNHELLKFIELGISKISLTEKSAVERKWLGIDKIQDAVNIAFPLVYSPYSAQSPTGQPQGLFIDMWRLWAQQTNTKINFVGRAITESLTLLENNEVDVLLGLPQAWIDTSRFTPAAPIYKSNAKIFIRNKVPNVESLDYFENDKHKIGLWNKSPFKQDLLVNYPSVKFSFYANFDTLLKAAELGEIDAFIGHADFMDLKLLQNNLQSLFYTFIIPTLSSNIMPIVNKGNVRLVNIINEGFEQIDLKELVNIEERWLIDKKSYFKSLLVKVTLNKQEESYISENTEIKVGVLNSLAPTAFYNEDGVFDGIDRSILDLVSQRTGLNFNYHGFDSWLELYESMLAGNIDMITSITPTDSRKERFLFSDAYWQTPWVILHPQHLGRLTTLTRFYGKELAIVKGFYLFDFLRDNHPQINLKVVNNRQDGLIAIQQGKVEGFVETISSATQLLKQESFVNMTISVVEGMPTDHSHIGIQKNNPLLASILDKGLASISVQEKNDIHEKWFSIDINTGLDKDVVMRVAMQVALLILIILVIIIMWNRRLKAEVTHRKQLEEKMKYMATHDDLTGLANRVLLKDRINTAIELHQRQSLLMAVLFLDLDGFKNVNDSHGHDVGDELLLLVARRLQSCVRKSDTVVRFGGDEFVLLLTGLHHNNEASFVAEKVLKLLQSPFELSSTKVIIGCSIGISMYPSDGTNDSDLLKEADTLMYQVKAAGKNHYLFNENNHSVLG